MKIAIQKNGRLTEDTVQFLRSAGLEFESYTKKLFSQCRNFPLEIVYVRDDDIAGYVQSGVVDLGIVGQNLVREEGAAVSEILNLQYGYCSLCLAVAKESSFRSVSDLAGQTIATSYPRTTASFFKKEKVQVNVITISGSVEVTPILGVASGIVDLVSSGSTLALNDLRVIEKISTSEAVLISNPDSPKDTEKKRLMEKLLVRFRAVLAARNYKYIMMNAPEDALEKMREMIPGLKSPTVSRLATPGWISIQSVVQEDTFWDTIEKLKALGATDILVLPIEKLIL